MMVDLTLTLPDDLEDLATRRFDRLREDGRILYEPTKPEYLSHQGFPFEFRICPFLKSKPIKGPQSGERDTADGPFVNPDPDEVLVEVGSHHRVMLNTFCMFRPMLLVTTKEFELQEDELNKADLQALWAVLTKMKTPQVAFYNCGVYSGSSQGHKHMQLFPAPDPSKIKLFPSEAKPTEAIQDIEYVPFKNYVLRLPENPSFEDVYSRYTRLLESTKAALQKHYSLKNDQHLLDETKSAIGNVEDARERRDHNLILTKEWIAIIPRVVRNWDGPWGSNSMGMIGMVAIRDDTERQEWTKRQYSHYLRDLGIPK